MDYLQPVHYLALAYFLKYLVEYFVRVLFCLIESRIIMEVAVQNLPANSRSFTLSGEGLTAAYCLEHLSAMTAIDLSNNSLRHLHAPYHLQFVQELNLSNNSLTACECFDLMPRLETLDLRHNGEFKRAVLLLT